MWDVKLKLKPEIRLKNIYGWKIIFASLFEEDLNFPKWLGGGGGEKFIEVASAAENVKQNFRDSYFNATQMAKNDAE